MRPLRRPVAAAAIAALSALTLTTVAVLDACSGPGGNSLFPDATAGSCIPGQQIGCPCGGGAIGAQVCNANGSGYGACTSCTLPDGAMVGFDGGPLSSDDGSVPIGSGDDGGGILPLPGYDGSVVSVTCPAGTTTTLSGTVYDPAGKNPVYGVSVYVPDETPQPFPSTATCSCNGLYPLHTASIATTDAAGRFTLRNVPSQTVVPLVLQIGKWRTQLTPTITPCQPNTLADRSLTLPKNHLVGEIPQIAISTGSADSLECLLVRVGLDPSEYGGGASGEGHIHIFQGGGTAAPGPNTSPAGPQSSAALWDSTADLMKYDMVFLSCEGAETTAMNQQALYDYAAAGGRVFASHFHYSWFDTGPFAADDMAAWSTGTNDIGNIGATFVTTLRDGGTFTKGQGLFSWISGLDVLEAGALPIQQARENATVTPANAPAQAWLTTNVENEAGTGTSVATQYFSYNTTTLPDAGAPRECGRVVYSDIHVGAASNDYGGLLGTGTQVVPTGCTTGSLSPQEDVLEFMLFDLSSCVTVDQ